MVIGLVHTLSDIRRLLVESHQHGTAVGVESTGTGAAVSDLLDHVAHQVDEVHLSFRGHFTGDHAQTGVHHRFAGHTAGGILRQESIKHRVTHLIADFVWMSFGN